MQRYRVNYPLLIGLVVGSLLLAVGLYVGLKFQQNRNAGRLLTRAAEAREEGDLLTSAKLLRQYVILRDEDDEAKAKLANTLADFIDDPKAQPKDIGQALSLLEITVREQPDNFDLRRRLVDLLVRFNSLKPALDHLGQLINQRPEDKELLKLRSECLFKSGSPKAVDDAYRLIGYDQKEKAFNVESATLVDDPQVYRRLAAILRSEQNNDDLADQVIEQMVEANPESGLAHLNRGQYLAGLDEERSKEDIKAALALSPGEPQIVIANALLKVRDEQLEEARQMLRDCLAKNEEVPGLYQVLASLDASKQDYDAAMAIYTEGIEKVPANQSGMLHFDRTRMQIEQKQFKEAERSLKRLRDDRLLKTELIDYLEARMMIGRSEWFKASKEIDRLQPFLSKVPRLAVESNVLLGMCYEQMGQFEQAKGAYDIALSSDPTNVIAQQSRARMLNRLGQGAARDLQGDVYIAMAQELEKPKAEQNWDAFQRQIDKYAEQRKLSPAMKGVLETEVLMRRELYDEAQVKLVEAYELDKEDLRVRRAAVKLFASNPKRGPAKALKLLEAVIRDFGDTPLLRLDKADLLLAINDEQLSEQLMQLTEGMDDWERSQQVQVWNGLADRFGRIRDRESQQIAMRKIAELSPSDLKTLINLLVMAAQENDEAAIKDAQDRILKVVGSKEDPTWLFTEAHRLATRYRVSSRDESLLDEAQGLVARAMESRPQWHQLYLMQATIDLLKNNAASALKNLDRASELGRPTAASLYQHAKLLAQFGRYNDVIKQVEKLGQEARVTLLGREYADSLLRVGRIGEAIDVADRLVAQAGQKGETQFWYGQFLQRVAASGKLKPARQAEVIEKSGEALSQAVELSPEIAEGWLALVTHHATRKEFMEADEALRRAQLELVEDGSLLFMARCYELVGRWIDAEVLYRQAVEQAEEADKPKSHRLLARFYLASYPRDDKFEKANREINKLLELGVEGKLTASDENLRWARSTAARLLASTRDYQLLLKAENLLSTNAIEGQLAPSDRLLMADILAPRPEPASRLKAIAHLEAVRKQRELSRAAELMLAKLYNQVGEWRKCREQMVDLIAKYPNDTGVKQTYIQMLVDRGGPSDISDAVRQLRRLKELAPDALMTNEMIARVALKQGRKADAAKALRNILPRDLKNIQPKDLQLVSQVAQLLIEFEDYKAAAPLYQLIAQRGGPTGQFQLASFVGSHLDEKQGFEALDKLARQEGSGKAIAFGLQILRSRSLTDDPIAEHYDLVRKWLERGLRDDPESVPLRLQRAELLDLEKEYGVAAEIYRDLLEGDELEGLRRAIVLNNLAYMLALSSSDAAAIEEAQQHVNKAVTILGPRSDILDTRAVISTAAGDYTQAVEDLTNAVTDAPTASKYFHKAVAHLMAEQNDEAADAWNQALELGLKREKVAPLEREQYDMVKSKLAELGLAS